MWTAEREPANQDPPSTPSADPDFAPQVEAAWAAGEDSWNWLAVEWGVSPDAEGAAAPGAAIGRWWDGPPWYGDIADADFRTIVGLYVGRYGAYSPDLPTREPGLLRAWLRAGGDAAVRSVAA